MYLIDSRLRGNDIGIDSVRSVIPAKAGIHADTGNMVYLFGELVLKRWNSIVFEKIVDKIDAALIIPFGAANLLKHNVSVLIENKGCRNAS